MVDSKFELVSLHDFAKMLGVHPRTLRRYVNEGSAPAHIRLKSGARLWRKTTIDAWLASRESLDGRVAPKRARRVG